jgi:NAD(P)-dependent dehydrogenase (short-subunit alcohol dehydrogenase family)
VDELKLLEVKGELHAVQGDVTKEEDVMRVVKWTRDNLGGADVLVNNAGVNFTGLLTGIEIIIFIIT